MTEAQAPHTRKHFFSVDNVKCRRMGTELFAEV